MKSSNTYIPALEVLVQPESRPSAWEWLATLIAVGAASSIIAAGISESLPSEWSTLKHSVISAFIAAVTVSLGVYTVLVRRMVMRLEQYSAQGSHVYRKAEINDITRRVIGSLLEQNDLNFSINLLLEDMGDCLDASRGYVMRYRDQRKWREITHTWVSPGQLTPDNFLRDIDSTSFSWWNQQLLSNAPFVVSDLPRHQMPQPLHDRLEKQNIYAMVAIPIIIFGELEGFIAYDTLRQPRTWRRNDLRMLGTMVDSLSRAIERRIRERQQTAAADRMEKALASAEAESRAKTDFLANMSHEIRTPMAAVVGYSDMLTRPDQSPNRVQECVSHIRRNADHLLSLVNDILDLSKIEAGELTMRIESCQLIPILEQIDAMVRPQVEEKMMSFEINYGGKVPKVIDTDPVRLKQVLMNLIGNAIKFTDEGKIEIHVTMADQAPKTVTDFARLQPQQQITDHAWLRIDVKDTGIGIDPANITRLFSPFTQVHDNSQRHYGGTGLGLDISRRLAHMLNAEILVDSTPGQGSVFSLYLDVGEKENLQLIEPGKQTDDAKTSVLSPRLKQNRLSGIRVLVVDDNLDNRRIARFFLEEAGAVVEEVGDGKQAIDAVLKNQQIEQPFELILMDMQMPVMDGYAATAELRSMGVNTPVIALTAYTMADDRRKCIDAGCNDYVSKPIVAEMLYDRIDEQLHFDTTDTASIQPANVNKMTPSKEEDAMSESPIESAPQESTEQNNKSNVSIESIGTQPELNVDEPSQPLRSEMHGVDEFKPLLDAYHERLPAIIEQMMEHWKYGRLNEIAVQVHQLKGTGTNYGYPSITEAARSCENAIRSKLPIEQIEPHLKTVIKTLKAAVMEQ